MTLLPGECRRARLVPFDRRTGAENMAIDECLLAWCRDEGAPILRIYGWDPAAISLGRYQRPECVNIASCVRDGVSVVRRITGGGAIFHDREVTYALACDADEARGSDRSVGASFERLNSFILAAFRGLGLDAGYAKECACRRRPGAFSDFCFCGNEEYDILVGGKKIGGMAQRRTGGSVLQHGSIPLSIDRAAVRDYFNVPVDGDRFTSLEEALGRTVTEEEVARALVSSFKEAMNVVVMERGLDERERGESRRLANDRYVTDKWNLIIGAGINDRPQAVLA